MDRQKKIGEIKAELSALADMRIGRLNALTASYIAASYVACVDKTPHLRQTLRQEQMEFFSRFEEICPVTTQLDSKESITLSHINIDSPIIIIANHPPLEKTIKPNADQFKSALQHLGREDLFEGTVPHLPGVIARRGIIASVMQEIVPGVDFDFRVVGAEFKDLPMSTIQSNDGSIVVPYGESGQGGFDMLQKGVSGVLKKPEVQPKAVVVAFPEGGNSRTSVDVLGPFHKGIFMVAENFASSTKTPVSVIPLVMGVQTDFSVSCKVLKPFSINLGDPPLQPQAIYETMQYEYTNLLRKMPYGYFWEGQTYPYGGPAREQIKNKI